VPQQVNKQQKTNMHDAPVCRPDERPEDFWSGARSWSQTQLVVGTASSL